MADKAREWTDEQLEKLEKKISKEYKQAEKELTQKWNAYMEKGEARLSALEQAVSDAQKSGDKDLIKEAQDKLQKAKENYTLQNTHYKDVVDSVTMDIAKVNQQALSYINGQLPNIYATNYEQVKDSLDELPVSYSLHNKSTVMNMIDKGDVKLPKKKINISKDQRWNTKKINSSVLQGILQGEPMDKIAKRLLPIMDNNKVSAIRNARTLVTGAENMGRLDSYKELEDQGIVLKKVWIATGDDRTRDSHLMLDGEEIDIDEEFPNGCQYPADPDCDEPSEVYNCRCSMRTHVVGFRKDDGSISYVDYEHESGLHQKQISEELERRGNIIKDEQSTINKDNAVTAEEWNAEAERQGINLTANDVEEYVESSYGAYELGDKISEFIDNAPDDMKVGDTPLYRGLYFDSEKERQAFINQDIIISRRDGLSWTESKDIATDTFATDFGSNSFPVVLVNDDDAKNAIAIYGFAETPNPSKEVLYSSSTDFDILEVEVKNDITYVYVTESAESERKY